MHDASTAWITVRERIARAERDWGRSPGGVKLVAVSKTCAPEAIRAVARCGQDAFGENYLQEALPKIQALVDEHLEWHFIGGIQSNKTALIATHFDWAHAIDRSKIAQRLNDQRPRGLPALKVCIEVNISGEPSKSGVQPADVAGLAHLIAGLPRLSLRGLMALPEPLERMEQQRRPFRELRGLLETLNGSGLALDTLSMGTTNDFEAAIAEGATLVRVGSAIFGTRPR